jgi:hypothetical protein
VRSTWIVQRIRGVQARATSTLRPASASAPSESRRGRRWGYWRPFSQLANAPFAAYWVEGTCATPFRSGHDNHRALTRNAATRAYQTNAAAAERREFAWSPGAEETGHRRAVILEPLPALRCRNPWRTPGLHLTSGSAAPVRPGGVVGNGDGGRTWRDASRLNRVGHSSSISAGVACP